MEYRRPISHGYLDPSHSLSTIDGIDSMDACCSVLNVVCFFEMRLALWSLVEKTCDIADT